jgi:hypothetical protein
MSSFNPWKSGAGALMALAITAGAIAPIVTSAPAFAQDQDQDQSPYNLNENRYQLRIPAGTRIPVRYEKAEKIVVTPKESTPVTLTVASDITNSDGTVLIPAGTKVIGKMEPAEGGTQFVASELEFKSGKRQRIEATSRVITRTQQVNKTNSGNILKGAAAGGGAAALLSAISGHGNIPLAAVLGGGAAGAVGGLLLGRSSQEVVVVYPNRGDLNLRLDSSLPVRY